MLRITRGHTSAEKTRTGQLVTRNHRHQNSKYFLQLEAHHFASFPAQHGHGRASDSCFAIHRQLKTRAPCLFFESTCAYEPRPTSFRKAKIAGMRAIGGHIHAGKRGVTSTQKLQTGRELDERPLR